MWGLEAPISLELSEFVIGDEEDVHGPQGGCLIVNVVPKGSCNKIVQGQRGGGGRVGRTKRARIVNFTTPKMKASNWTRTNMCLCSWIEGRMKEPILALAMSCKSIEFDFM